MWFVNPYQEAFRRSRIVSGWQNVRLVYLDEAGISNPAEEPILLVGSIIINADQDWHNLERHIISIRRKHLPPEDDYMGFVFHAQDIFHGSRYFTRDKWPFEKRRDILRDLAEIPRRFHVPIVCVAFDRNKFADEVSKGGVRGTPTPTSTTDLAHLTAFVTAVCDVDGWMLTYAPAEVAMLIAEDRPRMRSIIKNVHVGYTDPTQDYPDVFKTRHIIDTVTFASKEQSILLQLADMTCFVTKRTFNHKKDVEEFYELLRSQFISSWHGDPDAPQSFQVRVPYNAIRFVEPRKGSPS